MRLIVSCVLAVCLLGSWMASHVQAGPFDSRPDDLINKPLDQLSSPPSADWGRKALAINADRWEHGETAHFVIHYFKRGQKVATRCEKFYSAIQTFFGNRNDLMGEKKSHVYAFHDREDWRRFAAATGLGEIAGVTRGHEFFYISTDSNGQYDSKGKVQAHEMTHLIFNRFFKGTPPLWLNEGVAEYFGQRETSSTADFRRLMGARGRYPLDKLFSATGYPANASALHGFYSESAVIVDFLTHNADRERLLPLFVEEMIRSQDLRAALKLYGYHDIAEFKDKYERYRRSRY